jgi:tripartite-type tricarboxylate transporter receptor subunit TctC
MRQIGWALLVAQAALGLSASHALAQAYPSRPLRIVVPYPAGGAVDNLARIVGNKVSDQVNQPVIVENRAGAGGAIGADVVAKAMADGYSILQNTNGQAIGPSIQRSLAYDTLRDFVPVTQLVTSALILVASPKAEIGSLRQLIARAKSKPGMLSYGSSGVGNPLHLTMEMLKIAAGMSILAVPYRGDAQINTALIAGEIQVAIVPLATARSLIENGQLRALAVTGGRRSMVLPEVPTVAEAGIAGFASSSWQGWFLPGQTPRNVVAFLQRQAAKALTTPEIRDRLTTTFAYETVGSTPEEFDAFFRAELAKFAKVVKDANIPMQD